MGLVDGKFVDEDVVAGTPGSLIPAQWGNAVTEEVLNVIEAAGIVPSESSNDQLVEAINQLISAGTAGPATEAVAGIAKIATTADFSATVADDTKIVTIQKLKAWFSSVMTQATEAVFGWLKIATQLQVNAGSDDTTAITPKKLAEVTRSQASMAFTTTGTGAAYLMSPVPTVTALAPNQRYTVLFHASSTVTPTINISSLGAKRLKQYTATGAKIDATLVAGQISDVVYDGTDLVVMDQLPPPGVVQATETVLGGAEIATQPETNAGTDDATIVTPKKMRFGFTFSFATNGYFFLPSWLMGFGLQWGEVPNIAADATQTVSFPVSFPTDVFGMLANLKTGTAASQPTSVYSIATSVSGGQVARDTTTSPYATGPIFWVAFGR